GFLVLLDNMFPPFAPSPLPLPNSPPLPLPGQPECVWGANRDAAVFARLGRQPGAGGAPLLLTLFRLLPLPPSPFLTLFRLLPLPPSPFLTLFRLLPLPPSPFLTLFRLLPLPPFPPSTTQPCLVSRTVFGVRPETLQCSHDTEGNQVPCILLQLQALLYGKNGLQVCAVLRWCRITLLQLQALLYGKNGLQVGGVVVVMLPGSHVCKATRCRITLLQLQALLYGKYGLQALLYGKYGLQCMLRFDSLLPHHSQPQPSSFIPNPPLPSPTVFAPRLPLGGHRRRAYSEWQHRTTMRTGFESRCRITLLQLQALLYGKNGLQVGGVVVVMLPGSHVCKATRCRITLLQLQALLYGKYGLQVLLYGKYGLQ
ncbi:unnamed protein product, partial [Closterium sp. NIES-54]